MMADKIWYVVMVPMVYFSVAWCFAWVIVGVVRIVKAPKTPYTLRIFSEGMGSDDPPNSPLMGAIWDAFTIPSVRKYKPVLWIFLILFHVSLFLLLLAHLDILPQINTTFTNSQHMLGHGAIGVVLTLCLFYFLFRRFGTPVREVSVPGDYLILVLLLAGALSGDIISWGNSWTESGFVMTKADFGAYLESLVKFTFTDPRQFLSGSHYPVVGTHVLIANLLLIFLPFSKIMHFAFAVPLNKLRRG